MSTTPDNNTMNRMIYTIYNHDLIMQLKQGCNLFSGEIQIKSPELLVTTVTTTVFQVFFSPIP